MGNKNIMVVSGVILATILVGCGAPEVSEIQSITIEEIQTEEVYTEESRTEESQSQAVQAEEEVSETAEYSFADLAKYRFEFSSGAGAWSDSFTIEKDGSFKGLFHDSDMGVTGEGYENGTVYCCSYSGHFTDLTKINEYTYRMKLGDLSCEEQTETEEISEGVRYIYTGPYALGGTDTFVIYLPQTPVEELSEELCIWLNADRDSGGTLDMVAIVDETNSYGIYSYERADALEEAEMSLFAYKESYDYYAGLLAEADTTAQMVEYSGKMYELSDDCLNEIWHVLRYNVEEDRFQEILAEQRIWIKDKELAAKENSAEYEGGSFASVSYNDTLARLTMERCEELIAYLKE